MKKVEQATNGIHSMAITLAFLMIISLTWNVEASAAANTGNGGRKLLSHMKEVLEGLEDAVLEPPTKKNHRHKTKYLPDLLGNSLADYPRRVFIDVGPEGRTGSEKWLDKHYPPKKGVDFDVVRIDDDVETVVMEEWMIGNVKEEEYVVMKAEAEVVEEMMMGKAMGLVDELFLGCKNQWMRGKKSKRAYWECLALYGKLKDEGVAVHQWWD